MLYSCPFLFEAGHMFFVEVDAEVRIRQFSQYFSWQQGFELADDPCQARDGYNEVEPKTKIMKDYIKENLTKQANVIRDGQSVTIPRREIVCGDIVEINAGDEIPADLRIPPIT